MGDLRAARPAPVHNAVHPEQRQAGPGRAGHPGVGEHHVVVVREHDLLQVRQPRRQLAAVFLGLSVQGKVHGI